MRFKEQLQRYKRGESTEEERSLVEEELEKYRELNDYYIEEIEGPLSNEPVFSQEDNEDLRKMKQLFKKRDFQRGAKSAFQVLLILLIGFLLFHYLLTPFINTHFFYNPTKCTYDDNQSDLTFFLSAWNELNFAERRFDSVSVYATIGIGKYALDLRVTRKSDDQRTIYPVVLDKGALQIDDIDFLMDDGSFFFFKHDASTHVSTEDYPPFDKKNVNDILSTLPEYIHLQVGISFQDDLSMEEFVELQTNGLCFNYVTVRTAPLSSEPAPYALGFDPNMHYRSTPQINKDYPFYGLGFTSSMGSRPYADLYEDHFKSLIRYYLDHHKLVSFGNNEMSSSILGEPYEKALDYVTQHGVQAYGVVVQGYPNAILELYNNPKAKGLYILNMNLSLKNKNIFSFQ